MLETIWDGGAVLCPLITGHELIPAAQKKQSPTSFDDGNQPIAISGGCKCIFATTKRKNNESSERKDLREVRFRDQRKTPRKKP